MYFVLFSWLMGHICRISAVARDRRAVSLPWSRIDLRHEDTGSSCGTQERRSRWAQNQRASPLPSPPSGHLLTAWQVHAGPLIHTQRNEVHASEARVSNVCGSHQRSLWGGHGRASEDEASPSPASLTPGNHSHISLIIVRPRMCIYHYGLEPEGACLCFLATFCIFCVRILELLYLHESGPRDALCHGEITQLYSF